MVSRNLAIAAAIFMTAAGMLGVDGVNQAHAQGLGGPATGSGQPTQSSATNADEILTVQRLLYNNGFAIEHINGELTAETVEAIRSFQRQNSLRVDGRVTMSLMTYLTAHILDDLPDGDSDDILGISDNDNIRPDPQSRQSVSLVQRVLSRHGFVPGRIDGVMDPLTTQAIRTFQARMNMPVTGVVDEAFLDTLGEFVVLTRDFTNTDRGR